MWPDTTCSDSPFFAVAEDRLLGLIFFTVNVMPEMLPGGAADRAGPRWEENLRYESLLVAVSRRIWEMWVRKESKESEIIPGCMLLS